MQSIEELIRKDEVRLKVLHAVASLNLPDCYVAAGFVRNLVWDHIHGFEQTALNDVDVIYFDKTNKRLPNNIRDQLSHLQPQIAWDVKNQPKMHYRNGDTPYANSADAMTYWPEIETAIGVRLSNFGKLEICVPFGTKSLLAGKITHNPKRTKSVFLSRVQAKKWLDIWPLLSVVCR